MDYDRTNIPETYKRGRDHGPAFLEQWMTVVATYVEPTQVHEILDLGCGTGRISDGLAVHFNARLIGIDPSIKMLRQALEGQTTPRAHYAIGVAEAVPLPANSVDMVFISMVFHHFTDPRAVAEECWRVLRPRVGQRRPARRAGRFKLEAARRGFKARKPQVGCTKTF